MLSTVLATGLGKRVPSLSTAYLLVRVLAHLLRKHKQGPIHSCEKCVTLTNTQTNGNHEQTLTHTSWTAHSEQDAHVADETWVCPAHERAFVRALWWW